MNKEKTKKMNRQHVAINCLSDTNSKHMFKPAKITRIWKWGLKKRILNFHSERSRPVSSRVNVPNPDGLFLFRQQIICCY